MTASDALKDTARHWQTILVTIVLFFGGVWVSNLQGKLAEQKADFIREAARLELRINQQQASHQAEMSLIATRLDTMNETLREMAVSLGQLQGKPD